MARLRVELGNRAISERDVDRSRIVIGRGAGVDVVLDDPIVSREHCAVEETVTGHRVVDLGSRAGTLVNGQPVKARDLVHGDRIEIGQFTLHYQGTSGDVRPAAPGAGASFAEDGVRTGFWVAALKDSAGGVVHEEPSASTASAPAPAVVAPAQASPEPIPSGASDRFGETLHVSVQDVVRLRERLERKRQPHLLALTDEGQVVVPLEKDSFVVGFAADCDHRVAGSSLFARRLFRVERFGDDFDVVGLSWFSPMSVGGARTRRRRLRDGDVIEAGGARFRFSLGRKG